MQEERSYKIKRLRKTGEKKEVIDSNGEIIQPGSRILKGYWGDWLVFGGRIPGFTLKLKIRIIPSGSKIRLINPLMTPDNNWEDKKTSVHIKWGDGQYDKIYKKKINSGRFNRDSDVLLEHTYTANVGDELWLEITSIEPLVPYGCEIVEMLGRFPYDRYDLNMDRDGHYCGLFGVDQYVEDYPELNKLYGAGRTITKVSSDLLWNWRNIRNMDRMFEGWGIVDIPQRFFRWDTELHPDPNPEGVYSRHLTIAETCESYYRTFADCPNLVTCVYGLVATVQSVALTYEEMFIDCVKLTNVVNITENHKLVNASKMYKNCKSLVEVEYWYNDDYGDLMGLLSGPMPALETIESIFEGCSSLNRINWDYFCRKAGNLINAKAAFRGTAFTEVAFNMREMTKLGSIEYMYADMEHLTNVVNSFSYETASEYAYWRHHIEDYGEKKLNISHLFENSGDRTQGIYIPVNFFQTASTTNQTLLQRFPDITPNYSQQQDRSAKLQLKATHIFYRARIDRYSSYSHQINPINDIFNGVFNTNSIWGNIYNLYDVSYAFSEAELVHNKNGTKLDRWIFGNDGGIGKIDFCFCGFKTKFIEIEMFNGYIGSSVLSARGLFKNTEIDYRFSPFAFFDTLPQSKDSSYGAFQFCTDYSEMFMNVKYKYPDFPVDHIVTFRKNQALHDYDIIINMTDMFTGSNMKSYRPISPLSDRDVSYDFTRFNSNPMPAPKEWIVNGFHDVSNWIPNRTTNPLIYWVCIPKDFKTFTFDNGYIPKNIDWGDGSTTPSNSHTYERFGVYKITIIDDVFGNPDTISRRKVFKIDGEFPYNSTPYFDYTQVEATRLQELGPNVLCFVKKTNISNMMGYVDPMNFRYGNNGELVEGLISVDIAPPHNLILDFSADFVLIDKTVDLMMAIDMLPLFIGKETSVELTTGITRTGEQMIYSSNMLSEPNLLYFPQSFYQMNQLNHSNYDSFVDVLTNQRIANANYLTPNHFAKCNLIHSLPSVTSYVDYENGIKYRLHPGVNKTNFNKVEYINPGNYKTFISTTSSSDLGFEIRNIRDERKKKYEVEPISFELENIPDDDIVLFRLDSLKYGSKKFRDRPLGEVKVQVLLFDEDEDEDNPERTITFDGSVIPNIGRIKSKDGKAILRVWSNHALWPSCCESIVGIYGVITNKEGDYWIDYDDFRFSRLSPIESEYAKNGLAPNVKHVSEDLLWGLQEFGQSFICLFMNTPIEEIPMGLLNNFCGISINSMFENCKKIRVIPDYLIKKNCTRGNKISAHSMFEGCTNVEYVFKPFASTVNCADVNDMFKGCRTYAFRGKTDIESEILKTVSLTMESTTYKYRNSSSLSATGIQSMSIPDNSSIPVLDHENDTIMCVGLSSPDIAKVATFLPSCNLNIELYKDNPYMLFRAQTLVWSNTEYFDEKLYSGDSFHVTSNDLFKMMHAMHSLILMNFHQCDNFTLMEPNQTPIHTTLFNNRQLMKFAHSLSGALFTYSPNLFLLHQDQMRYGTGLLYNVAFDKIPYIEYVPATHLPDKLGRPIYIGGGKDATRYRPRVLDRMLRYRNDFASFIETFYKTTGDLTCPKFTNHVMLDVRKAFAQTNTYVASDTFVDVDKTSSIFRYGTQSTFGIFSHNTSVDSDCRIFHIWSKVSDYSTGYEFEGTTKFIHPPKDMFSELTNLTTLYYTFYKSNVRSLPDCNPRIKNYDHFAASSKLSTIPEHWFKYNGTETLDIRYAFDDCKGLIVTDKLIDPTVTVPVLKYSSLRNAWSIIGDDPEIFAGVNTKLDGTDKSLVKVIPEEDMFKQTIDVHDPRWTLSVKALGMETIGHEPVQDDNLFMVIWGDGSSPSVVSYRDIEWEDYSHKYDAAGRYQVLILSTQWCCFVNSPQELSSKYTTYSIDGMFQNTTCEALAKAKLTSMFGHTVEVLYPTLFDKCSDIATVKDFPDMFFEFKKLKTLPDTILNKMVSLESLHRFIMTTGITSIPVKIFSKNMKLKDLTSAFERLQMPSVPADLFVNNPELEILVKTFCDNFVITEYPRNLFRNNPNLKDLRWLFALNTNCTMDDSYNDVFAVCTKVKDMNASFNRWKIKSLPSNLINRMTSLTNVFGMFANYTSWADENVDGTFDQELFDTYKSFSNNDSEFTIPSGFLPKSVINANCMFFFRIKLKAYPADIFTGNTVLNSARWMFMNTGITRVHSNTFHTMSGETLDIRKWLYKDKRLGKKFYSHYIPRFINPAINVKTVYTDSSLLGAFGTMTEAELFAGINTNPTNIHSLYVQEFEPATFKLKMNGDGTFITMKPITGGPVTFTDLTYIQWGDGTENLYEENMHSSQIQNTIKHIYKTPGTYTITVGAKYCLVPIVDTMPEAYQVESVVFPEDINQVKSVSIGGEYGVGHLEINRDKMYTERESAEVEMSLVPRPYYVGETYTVDVTVDLEGLDIGETTTLEVNVVRDASDPFERLEIGGVLGFMEGITTFPKISTIPELQYQKWIGEENFFDYNKHITSLDSSFMNIPFEIRFADKVFWALTNLVSASKTFWNAKFVFEPGWAPDFNNCKKLVNIESMFRGGINENTYTDPDHSQQDASDVPHIPVGTPRVRGIWNVNQNNYQPFRSLSTIEDMSYICYQTTIGYALLTNFTKLTNLSYAYSRCRVLSWLPADYFRTLSLNKTSDNISMSGVFVDTNKLIQPVPSSDVKTLLDLELTARTNIDVSSMFSGSGISGDEMINILNNCSMISNPAVGSKYTLTGIFSWKGSLSGFDASALKLNINYGELSGSLDMQNMFSYDRQSSETQWDRGKTGMINVKPGSIRLTANAYSKVKVNNMFDHCYASADVSDAHKVFVVEGDDANFTKAKKLADDSALNTLTVMTTTVVPK